jgi:hypothetical protein
MVPGSTLIYGSSYRIVTFKPRASRIAAKDAAAIPLPKEETTPPVTNIYRVVIQTLKIRLLNLETSQTTTKKASLE